MLTQKKISKYTSKLENNENLITVQKNELFSKFRLSKTSFQNKKAMIHVRRSDYLQLGIELPLEYYVEALKLLENKIDQFHFDIYTDDYEWVLRTALIHI